MRVFTFLFFVFFLGYLTAQPVSQTSFSLRFDTLEISQAPGIQSFAWGEYDGKWLLMGGRITGLHGHRPWDAFPASGANDQLTVVDPQTKQVWSTPLSGLPLVVQEQMLATNINFIQIGDRLILIGGYGYSPSLNDWITHPLLTVVDVPAAIQAITGNTSVAPAFSHVGDQRMAVTGGQMGYLDSVFYLVFGQRFEGRYNPHNGPSFTQTYTEAIRTFKLDLSGPNPQITDFSEQTDPANFHRRDYNMLPQVFADGSLGYTAFSGVFRTDIDLPWLDVVDIGKDTVIPRSDFFQYLNQYHTAHTAIFDSIKGEMYSLFFGGIGMYDLDNNGALVTDSLVPFTQAISQVTRFGNDSLVEYKLPWQMPDFSGASAEFIPAGLPEYPNKVIRLHDLPPGEHLIGYIYGGIVSSQPNIFMQFSGTSFATNRILRVYLDNSGGSTGIALESPRPDGLGLSVFPNPAYGLITVNFDLPEASKITLVITDVEGRVVQHADSPVLPSGSNRKRLDLRSLAPGMYGLTLRAGSRSQTVRISLK